VLVPAALTYCPAVQSVHAVQLDVFVVVLYVPLPHALQERSAVASPSAPT
jgi:hypothetical protein